MKKILLLLILVPLMAISQTIPADATALENLQITNNTTSLTATKVNVQDANGVINTISKSDLVNVVEVNDVPSLPLIGEVGKIYVVKTINKIYRWNGTFYQELANGSQDLQSVLDKGNVTTKTFYNEFDAGSGNYVRNGVIPFSGTPFPIVGQAVSNAGQLIEMGMAPHVNGGFIVYKTGAVNKKVNFAFPDKTNDSYPSPSLYTLATTEEVNDLQAALDLKENTFSKNTAFNKNFGTTAGTVAEGNDSRINNGQTAFSWGNHAGLYPSLTGTGASGTWGINISGNASSATNWGGFPADFSIGISTPAPQYITGFRDAVAHNYTDIAIKTFLGLGSNAYSSTPYLPLTGNSTVTGTVMVTGDVVSNTVFKTLNSTLGGLQIAKPAGGVFWQIGVGLVELNENLTFSNSLGVSNLSINQATGAATFSDSVTATSFNGSATLTGTPTAPTAAAGTNTTQIATTAFVTSADSGNVKLTGNQTISGQKSFSLTGKINMQTNNAFPAISVTTLGSNGQSAAEFINSSSYPNSNALRLQTGSSGGVGNMALNVSNQSSIGTGIFSDASNGGVSISSQSGNGDSYISNITLGGTGRNYVGRNNGTETYSVDKTGKVTAASYTATSLPVFENNAAASSLAVGQFYRTSTGVLMVKF